MSSAPKAACQSICPKRASDLWKADRASGTLKVLSDARLALDEFSLDEMGGFIWEQCDGRNTVRNIAARIAEACNGTAPPREEIEQDVLSFVRELRRDGLLDWDEESAVDVLLVIPPFPTTYSANAVETPEYSSPPLGLCYIASVLRDHGFRVAITDLHVTAGQPEDIVRACRQHRPRIVGITSTTPTFPNALQVARFVKAWGDDVVTVLGGAHATGLPESCARYGAFDFVCVGEGEQPMLELADALLRNNGDAKSVPHFLHLSEAGEVVQPSDCHTASAPVALVLMSRDNGKLPSGAPPAPKRINLDELPLPARDLLDLDRYYQKGAVISSRGCPIDCNFCACAAIVGRTYRVHSVKYVLDEIEHLIQTYGYRFIDFHDDTFNLQKRRVFDFCRAVHERELHFEWGCFCRAAQLTPEMAKAMAGAGCRVVQFGVEAGSDAMLKSIKKATSVRQIEEAVAAAANAEIQQIVCGFIIGHADDTEESVRDTINFGLRLRQLGATRLTLSLLTPYPGTEVFIRRKELGIELLTEDWEQYIFSRVVMETRNLKRDRLRELYVDGICKFLTACESTEPSGSDSAKLMVGRSSTRQGAIGCETAESC